MAARIGPERKDVFFVMVGGAYGPLEEERMAQLRQAVKALGLDGRVIQTGFKEDVRPWVQALDVLCHPTRQEACSRAILEAMACGAAVTAFNDGGNPELIVNNESGRLVPAGDEEALAKAVLDLLDDAPARNAMGQAARERVKEHFTLRRNAEATMELYEALRRGAIHRAR